MPCNMTRIKAQRPDLDLGLGPDLDLGLDLDQAAKRERHLLRKSEQQGVVKRQRTTARTILPIAIERNAFHGAYVVRANSRHAALRCCIVFSQHLTASFDGKERTKRTILTMARMTSDTQSLPFDLSEEVAHARTQGRAVVALESTIITHGMPYPGNLDMAQDVETIIRDRGATPATIAVIDGRLKIGLKSSQLETLARTPDALKLSRADLAFAMVTGQTGATTVAATMIAAALADIAVFATGGIGGVHRGGEISFDISADLEELWRSDVIVVCAGAKAILDLPKTLEVLETRGVPVVTVGSNRFPAFWSRDSGLETPLRLDKPADIAAFAIMRKRLGMTGGMLVANPIPKDAEIPAEDIGAAIEASLAKADRHGMSGKAVTPFVLAEMLTQTDGRSLLANIALVRNNAALAADIAMTLADADQH